MIKPGEIVFMVLSRVATNEKGKTANGSIDAAIHLNEKEFGYLAEYQSFNEKNHGEFCEELTKKNVEN